MSRAFHRNEWALQKHFVIENIFLLKQNRESSHYTIHFISNDLLEWLGYLRGLSKPNKVHKIRVYTIQRQVEKLAAPEPPPPKPELPPLDGDPKPPEEAEGGLGEAAPNPPLEPKVEGEPEIMSKLQLKYKCQSF